MKEDIVPGGKGDGVNLKKFNKKELHVGIAVELEHTDDKRVALEISVDHLAEDPQYYSKLIKSGLVDEKPALELAKKYGMIGENKMKESELRKLIKEEVRNILSESSGFQVFRATLKNGDVGIGLSIDDNVIKLDKNSAKELIKTIAKLLKK